jgi:hypothetical protein
MKTNEPLIPVRSVVLLPRWLLIASIALCSVLGLGCIGLMVWGAVMVDHPGGRWGLIGGGFGGLIGCAGGMFGTLRDWRRRLPPPPLLRHLLHDAPMPFYRYTFWPAVAATIVGLALLPFCERVAWQPFLQTGGILAFCSGGAELIRRHTTKQARALFALYADGALEPADANAIGEAIAKDPAFAEELRAYRAISEQVRRLASGA